MNRHLRREVSEVATRTSRWLTSAQPELVAADTSILVQSYLSFALCCDLAPSVRAEIVPQLHTLHKVFTQKHIDDLWQCGNSGAVLLSCIVQQRYLNSILPAFADYVEKATAVLSQVQREEINVDYYPAYFLLYRLGRLPVPLPPVVNWPEDLLALLVGDKEQLNALATQIAVQTAYGAQTVKVPTGLVAVLEASALHSLQAYDFELGGILLRALAYLGENESLAMRTARSFIVENQSLDGSFGFLASEIAHLRTQRANFDPLDLQVPITLACLWTLAETGPQSYSLFHHLSGVI